jgi:hypothetical protein
MKVKIKVAVAANSEGSWNAYGYSGHGDDWDDIMDAFEALYNERRFWVEAELDVPDDLPTVQAGSVKTAEHTK